MKTFRKIIGAGVGIIMAVSLLTPGVAQVVEPGPCVWLGEDAFGFNTPCDFTGSFSAKVVNNLPLQGGQASEAKATMSLTQTDMRFGSSDENTLFLGYEGVVTVPIVFVVNDGSFDPPKEVASVVYDVQGETEWKRRDGIWRTVTRATYDATVIPSSLPCGAITNEATTGNVLFMDAAQNELVDLGDNTGFAFLLVFGSQGSTVEAECPSADGFERLHNVIQVAFDLVGAGSSGSPQPTGAIKGQLRSAAPLDTTDGNDVQQATVQLYQQAATVRAQNPDEPIDDYIQFLDDQGRTLVSTIQVTPANRGSVSFDDLPIVDDATGATLAYTLQVSEGSTEVRDPNDPAMTRTVNFDDTVLPNLVAEAGDTVTVHEIPLTPLAGFEVNSTGDASDANVEDSVCDTGTTMADGSPECTLRAAIEQANAKAGADLISFRDC